jgi:phosphoribosylformylglycinamidine cyclo-ligase
MPFIWKLFRSTLNYNNDLVENIPLEDHYAAVIKVSDDICVAIKTDGVGTKTFIAQLMDTVGIDCIAMNVNDIICVGAKPTTFIDYLALHKADQSFIKQIMMGLKRGAEIAQVSIVGGETAIMPEMVNSVKDDMGFDLAGSSLGIVNPSKVITGDKIKEGDVLIGISSSGIHSNGLTLARKVLNVKENVHKFYDELGRS